MSNDEIIKVIQRIDEALVVFNSHEGEMMTAKQLSVKSMLMALRAQMLNEQRQIRARME